jgi:hypothetical protein
MDKNWEKNKSNNNNKEAIEIQEIFYEWRKKNKKYFEKCFKNDEIYKFYNLIGELGSKLEWWVWKHKFVKTKEEEEKAINLYLRQAKDILKINEVTEKEILLIYQKVKDTKLRNNKNKNDFLIPAIIYLSSQFTEDDRKTKREVADVFLITETALHFWLKPLILFLIKDKEYQKNEKLKYFLKRRKIIEY